MMDHPQRDLAGLLLVAFDLCQHGVTCHIVPANLQNKEIWALEPDFVLLNLFRRGNEKLARHLVEAGIPFGLLDTEGGVWESLESYRELLWTDGELLKRAACVCNWGPKMAEYTTREGIFTREQTTVTGCPRFDFYHPTWRPVLADRTGSSTGAEPGTILINTNFSITNSRFVSLETNIEQFRSGYGWSDEKINTVVDAEQQAVQETIRLAGKLANDYPHRKIVLRPHPFENQEVYRQRLGHFENLEINLTGPVQPQIYRALVVIQRSCTTGIEATFAGVPTLSPRWIPAPYEMPTVEAVSVPCATYRDIRSSLDAILDGSYQPTAELKEEIGTTIHQWFLGLDGRSHERVSSVILGLLKQRSQIDRRLCSRFLYELDGARQRSRADLSRHLRYNLRLSPDWSFRRMRIVPNRRWVGTDKYFGVTEVRELVSRIADVARAQGRAPQPISVEAANERGDYSNKYFGYSITMQEISEISAQRATAVG